MDLAKDTTRYKTLYSMISERFNAVSIYYESNTNCKDCDYRELTSEAKKSLISMVNGAETLSELLNKSLG